MSGQPQLMGLVGESEVFTRMLAAIRKIANFDAPVLISGETGSGKELAARAMHYLSKRSDKPFIPVNCGALPDHLIENELFGHCRGAYTDAREAQSGLIAQAQGGTLFLDEVDALSAKAQVSLLRFLQNGTYRQLGSGRLEAADVRVLAASNVDLAQRVLDERFRADLHYRINVMELRVPPLRERGDDVVLLARHFIAEAAFRYALPPRELHPDSIAWLVRQRWPGNARELQNQMQREFLMCEGAAIVIQPARPAVDRRQQADRRVNRGVPVGTLDFNAAKQLTVQAFEREHLIRLMRESTGNVSRAARLAGKERRALGKLLKKYSIEPAIFRV